MNSIVTRRCELTPRYVNHVRVRLIRKELFMCYPIIKWPLFQKLIAGKNGYLPGFCQYVLLNFDGGILLCKTVEGLLMTHF